MITVNTPPWVVNLKHFFKQTNTQFLLQRKEKNDFIPNNGVCEVQENKTLVLLAFTDLMF